MAYGIKVSQTGHDVKTCQDKDLVFSSEWNTYKIKQEVLLNVVVGTPYTYNHNLGYIPFVWAFYRTESGEWAPDGFNTECRNNIPLYFESFNTSVNSTSILINIDGDDTGETRSVKLFLMEKII